jgi:hypothetical protein
VSADEPPIGTVIDGRFELRERLGSGAMGVVYRACQLSIDRDVALKVVKALDDDAQKRFVREAKITSALAHPNIVQIVEFGSLAGGGAYLAMELVRGTTLLSVLELGPMPLPRIVRIGAQLCDALEAAHRLGIVHRDLKPENIMIATDGSDHIKVLDFGIARILGDASMQVTTTGLAAGTPHYMAPEVMVHAAEPTPRQDMYAVGVILSELSLGETLYKGVTSLNMLLIAKMKNTGLDGVAPRLRPLVMRLLEEEPTNRPAAAEVRAKLRELERLTTDPAGIAQTAHLPGLASLNVVGLDERQGAAPRPTPSADASGPPLLELEPVPPPSPRALVQASPMPAADETPELLASFGPPAASVPGGELSLEVDGAWAAEREARKAGGAPALSPQAARYRAENPESARHARKRFRSTAPVIVLLLLAAAGGGAYYVTSRKPASTERTTAPTTKPSAPAPPARTGKARGTTRESPTPDQPTLAEHGGISIRIVGPAGTPITIDGIKVGKLPLSLKRSASTKEILIEGPGIVRQIVPDRSQTVDLSR